MRAVAVIVEWRHRGGAAAREVVKGGHAVLEFGGHLQPRIDHGDADPAAGPTGAVHRQCLPQDGGSRDGARRVGVVRKENGSDDDVQHAADDAEQAAEQTVWGNDGVG